MTGQYSSFLIRRWYLASGTQRIVVEHVQSGERAFVPTLDAATAWIGDWSGNAGHTTDTPAAEIITAPDLLPEGSEQHSTRGDR